ncbi:MAG: type II secretion system-associated lipoprotein [Spirochaetia bacterium]|nr:type II secretion system-associated lipoprotein [Spirochaetia bacterium]
MNDKKITIFAGVFIVFTIFSFCSGRFVKREELNYFSEKYAATYVLKKEIDIGNNKTMKAGTQVKLYFISDSSSVKVYAYLPALAREEAVGKNILLLFESDFPDEKYDREFLEKRLEEILSNM